MTTLQIRIDDGLKERVAEQATKHGSDISSVVRDLLQAFADGRLPHPFSPDTVVLDRLPSDAELMYAISSVASHSAIEGEINSARYLPLLFTREIVEAIQDTFLAYTWG